MPDYLLTIYQKYNHIVFSMQNHLSINKVVSRDGVTFISEFFKPYFGLIFHTTY